MKKLKSKIANYAVLAATPNTSINLGNTGAAAGAGPFDNLSTFVNFVINLVFGIGIAVSLVFLIVCGIKYATSSGDQGKAEEARNCITNAIIGAVVIIAFRLLVGLALDIFGLGELNNYLGGGSSSSATPTGPAGGPTLGE